MGYSLHAHATKEHFYCNRCCKTTRFFSPHEIQADHFSPYEPIPPHAPKAAYRLWICESCAQDAMFTKKLGDSQQIFPAREEGWRKSKAFQSLENSEYEALKSGYQNTVSAYNHGLETLCAMGIRSCMEWVCIERGCNDGRLVDKIARLHEMGYINPAQKQALDTLRFLGNDAAHEMKSPGRKKLELGLVILESLFDSLYEVIATAKAIRSSD